jgi:hypothetical protein
MGYFDSLEAHSVTMLAPIPDPPIPAISMLENGLFACFTFDFENKLSACAMCCGNAVISSFIDMAAN